MIEEIQQIACRLFADKFGDANVLLLAGSVIKGESTANSDIDIVVLFEHLSAAYRETFEYGDWPVEAFVHNLATLKYFIEKVDGPTGVPSLASMVVEGVAVPGVTRLYDVAKKFAETSISHGPSVWNARQIDQSRYEITDLIYDLSDPRSTAVLYASASRLYEKLADHYLRSSKQWSAKGKAIPRRLRHVSTEFAESFERAFEKLFSESDTGQVTRLANAVLASMAGGCLPVIIYRLHPIGEPPMVKRLKVDNGVRDQQEWVGNPCRRKHLTTLLSEKDFRPTGM